MSTKRIKLSAIALASTVLFSALPVTSAEAQYYHRRHTGEAIAGGVIGGVVGGLAVGALMNANRPVYHPPVEVAPTYVEDTGPYLRKRPVYFMRPGLSYQPTLEVVPSCYMSRQRIWLDRYTYTHRYTRVCD